MTLLPFRQVRTERLISSGRLALAAFSLLAHELDPMEPAAQAGLAKALLAGYLVFALVVVGLAWGSGLLLVRLRLGLHAIDLTVVCLMMWLTEGSTSPLFLVLVFTLIAAALRWPWPGTLWTAALALAVYLGLGWYTAQVLGEPAFELNRFVLRAGYLVVTAALVCYFGAHEHRLRSEIAGLATWPRGAPREPDRHVRELLERASELLAAPRLLLVWEEPDEPWVQLALWSPRGSQIHREPPGTFEPLVAEPLAGVGFLCPDAGAPEPAVSYAAADGIARWRGAPLHPAFQERFEVRSVLALVLDGEGARGRLLALDKPRPSPDDLALGEAVARRVEAELEQLYYIRRLQEGAAADERVCLARDLHDGVIQSLGGAALRLETARRLMKERPGAAGQLLVEIQDLLTAEQQDLRSFVHDPSFRGADPRDPALGVESRLAELRHRIERIWDLEVEITNRLPEAGISPALAHEIDRILREALVNAAKHGQASAVRAALDLDGEELRITVEDDGRGFPFRGDYDFAKLKALKLGPVALKQRIAAVGGSMRVTSGETGARLDIRLPLR